MQPYLSRVALHLLHFVPQQLVEKVMCIIILAGVQHQRIDRLPISKRYSAVVSIHATSI